ncbi:FimV/HubP family polar landmark protein [Photobacterium damselae]|uniref:FimV/HubP family polar landmark protein n=1 Tax=Photobacterium damselae TaxID=38293 RepID=UPI00406905A2
MSELSQALKRILLPVALATAFGGIAPAYANTVRIVGPENEDPNAWVQHSEQMRSSSFDYVKTPNKPYTNVRRYGPTSAKETLWSIASRHRPNNSVSVYQVIGAIKHINPQAFENNNIHGLIPGSYLVMPTLAQIKREDTQLVRRVLEQDKLREPYASKNRKTTTSKPSTKKAVVKKAPVKHAAPTSQTRSQTKAQPKPAVNPAKSTSTTVESADHFTIPAKPTVPANKVSPSTNTATKAALATVATATVLGPMAVDAGEPITEQSSATKINTEQPKAITSAPAQVTSSATGGDNTGANTVSSQSNTASVQRDGAIPPKPQDASANVAASLPQDVSNPVNASDEQLTQLIESNHMLKVRLAEMQQEMASLREQVGDDDEFRNEVINFIRQQRQQEQAVPEENKTFWLNQLADHPTALIAAGLIPGGLLAGLLAFFLYRRGKKEEQEEQAEKNSQLPLIDDASSSEPNLDSEDKLDELDDLLFDDDLFADSNDKLEQSLDCDLKQSEKTGLSESELSEAKPSESETSQSDPVPEPNFFLDDFDLNDDFDVDMSSKSVSVNGEEAALGLEEMERAIDQMDTSHSDEDLAAQWERSLQQEKVDIDSDDFDLSEGLDESFEPLEPKSEQELLDQSMLDDLLVDIDSQLAEPVTSEPASDVISNEKASLEPQLEQEPFTSPTVEDSVQKTIDELDISSKELAEESANPTSNLSAESQTIPEVETAISESSTQLLDELVTDEDDLLGADLDIDLDENSVQLLDELIPDEDDKIVLEQPLDLAENSTALLDELVDDWGEKPTEAIAATVEHSQEIEPLQTQVAEEDIDDILDQFLDQELEQHTLADEAQESSPHDYLAPEAKPLTVEELERELDRQEAEEKQSLAQAINEFPIFDEQAALDELDEREPNSHVMPETKAQSESHIEAFELDDLPEFDEQSALNDPEAESLLDEELALSDEDQQRALDNVVRQLQEAVEASERYQQAPELLDAIDSKLSESKETPPQELASSEEITKESISEPSMTDASSEPSAFDEHKKKDYDFAHYDPASLPEFNEDEALQASFEEQYELEQYEREKGFSTQRPPHPIQDDYVANSAQPLPSEFDHELVESAGLDMAALLTDPDLGLADAERDGLLAHVHNDTQDDDDLDSDEQALWHQVPQDPSLENEDWSQQPSLAKDDIDSVIESIEHELEPAQEKGAYKAFQQAEELTLPEAGSELISVAQDPKPHSFISIDELMKETQGDGSALAQELDAQPLKLDVGLDEFPDVLTNIAHTDVDDHAELASKLDLAKAYLEMNDKEGAIELLEEVTAKADGAVKAEAEKLLNN